MFSDFERLEMDGYIELFFRRKKSSKKDNAVIEF